MADRSDFDFAAFPRRDLAIRIDRRQLFRGVVNELRVAEGKSQGGQALRLTDLGTLPDEQLATIRPIVVPGCVVRSVDGFAWGRIGESGPKLKLFPLDSPSPRVFAAFDGATSLGELAIRLSSETGWDPAYAQAYARGLFLHLVTFGVCLPA